MADEPADSDRLPGAATPAAGSPRRSTRAAARTSPEAMAAARGGAVEGLAWLGRRPETKGSPLFWVLRALARFLAFPVFRFRVTTSGQEHVPAGACLVVAAVHRGWMDPFLIMHALPPEPRVWFLGSGPSAFDRRWKEWLLRRVGGMLPVWRGGVGVDQHVESARAVLAAGGVFVLVPEGGISGPPDRPSAFRVGSALIALRTTAPIVPLAIAGSGELYLGKRLATRVLPVTSARELLGDAWDGALPRAGSRDELDLARELTQRLHDLLAPVVAELYPATVDPPGRPRRLRGLTRLFL